MTQGRRDVSRVVGSIIVSLVVFAAGCKKQSSTVEVTQASQPNVIYSQIDLNTAGTISGTVKFAKKAPPRVEIDMAQDPACSLSSDPNYSEQYMVKNGKLQNVFIYVKDGLGNKIYPAPSTPVQLDQKGCRYVPHVIGVMVGQPVEFTNSDPTMHNIHTTAETPANPEVDISQPPKGGTTQRTFAKPELMIPVRCNNHPWMQAFINVSPNPLLRGLGRERQLHHSRPTPRHLHHRRRPRSARPADHPGDRCFETNGDG